MARWIYQGDCNLRHGGKFYNLTDIKHDYADCVCVTDLDSALGYNGGWLIQSLSIPIPTIAQKWNIARINGMIDVCGYKITKGRISDGLNSFQLRSKQGLLMLLEGLVAYGYYDTLEQEIVAIGKDAPESFDGWKLNKRLRSNASLRNYVKKNWL